MTGVNAPKLPAAATLLGALDNAARDGLKATADEGVQILRGEAPRGRTGIVQGAMQGRVTKTATGREAAIGPKRRVPHGDSTAAQVVRWVTRGTGELRRGPGSKRPIKAKRRGGTLILPGGRRVVSVRGQAANPFIDRARVRMLPVAERNLEQAAAAAQSQIALLIQAANR